MSKLVAYAAIAAILPSLLSSIPANAGEQPQRLKDGFYVGAYGGLGAFDPSGTGESLSSAMTRFLQGQQNGTANRNLIEESRANGIPIEIVDSLPDRDCPPTDAANPCYVITEKDVIVANVAAAGEGATFVRLQGGVRARVRETVDYSTKLGGTGGAVLGYRRGIFRAEADVGLSVFSVERTTRTTSGVDVIRPVVPDTVAVGVREQLQQQIDDALDNSQDLQTGASVDRDTFTEIVPTLTANAFVDLPTGEDWQPYLGAGLGVGLVNDDIRFVWQLQTGLNYDVMESVTLSLGYRFQTIENTNFGDLESHTGLVGVRFNW